MCLIELLILFRYLYLSGTWLGVALQMDTKKDKCLKEIGLCAQDMITILGSIVNII